MYYYELINVPPTNIFDIRHLFDIEHFIFSADHRLRTVDREERKMREKYSFLQGKIITENKPFL